MKTRSLFFVLFLVAAGGLRAQDMSNINFTLRDVDGVDRSFQDILKEVRGADAVPKKGAIIISFWAMWCEPCKQEMKALRPLFEKLAGKNLRYLAINTDDPKSLAKVRSWVAGQKLPYTFLLDPNKEVFNKLGGLAMPYSLILDAGGKLIAKRTGFQGGDEKEIEADILKILE
jgi:cytochrome c biogenesis protein CcmG, thiol:disulfide interchange protein DsbE